MENKYKNKIVFAMAISLLVVIGLAIADLNLGNGLNLSSEKETILKNYIKENLNLKSSPSISINVSEKECWYNGKKDYIKVADDEYDYPNEKEITCKVEVNQEGLIHDYFLIEVDETEINNCCSNEVNELINKRLNAQADSIVKSETDKI